MAVSSPYAVFRAADLGWPSAAGLAPAGNRRVPPRPTNTDTPSSEGVLTTGHWATLIQGDLFEFNATGA